MEAAAAPLNCRAKEINERRDHKKDYLSCDIKRSSSTALATFNARRNDEMKQQFVAKKVKEEVKTRTKSKVPPTFLPIVF